MKKILQLIKRGIMGKQKDFLRQLYTGEVVTNPQYKPGAEGKKSMLTFCVQIGTQIHGMFVWGEKADEYKKIAEKGKTFRFYASKHEKEENGLVIDAMTPAIDKKAEGAFVQNELLKRRDDLKKHQVTAEEREKYVANKPHLCIAATEYNDGLRTEIKNKEDCVQIKTDKGTKWYPKTELIMDMLGASKLTEFLRAKARGDFKVTGWKEYREELVQKALKKLRHAPV